MEQLVSSLGCLTQRSQRAVLFPPYTSKALGNSAFFLCIF